MYVNDGIILYLGDSLQILPTLRFKPDLVIADPPYYGVIKESWDRQWKNKQEYLEWSKQWIQPTIALMPEHASFYIWGNVKEQSDTLLHLKLLIDNLGLYFKDWITWQKSRGVGNRRGWMYAREEILWYVKNNQAYIWNNTAQYDLTRPSLRKDFGANGKPRKNTHKRYTTVWSNNEDQRRHTGIIHYTPKPEKLIERIILAHTKPNDLILDPFVGSGTTCVVAKKLGRRCIGIEKDPIYYNTSIERINHVASI
jgi:DNA modification methylase